MACFIKSISVTSLVGCAVLAFIVPEAHGQNRFIHTRPITTPRQVHSIRTTIPRTQLSFPTTRFRSDPFRRDRFGFDPFLGRQFDRFEDRFERRFGFDRFRRDPFGFDRFLGGRFGFDPFFGNGFGFNPFIGDFNSFSGGGGFGSLGSAVIPFSSGSLFSLSDGGAGGKNGQAGSLVDEQQAALLQEQVLAERLGNRRKLFDEYLYEREKTPPATGTGSESHSP